MTLLLAISGMAVICSLAWRARLESTPRPAVPNIGKQATISPPNAGTLATASRSSPSSNVIHHIPTIAEKRLQRTGKETAKAAEIQARVMAEAERVGKTPEYVMQQLKVGWKESEAQHEADAYRQKQMETDLAKGVNVEIWKRELELEQLSSQLHSGMTVPEAVELLGKPFEVKGDIWLPGAHSLTHLTLESSLQHPDKIRLIYSPHPQKAHHNISDNFRVLEVHFDSSKRLISWKYIEPSVW